MACVARYLLLFSVAPLFLAACVTMRSLPIETLQPADLSFESPKKNIAICARKTLLEDAAAANEGTRGIPTDSLINNILFSLKNLWENTHGFENTNFAALLMKADDPPPGSPKFDIVVEMDKLYIVNNYYAQQYGYQWEAYIYVAYSANWQIRDGSGGLIDNYTDNNRMFFSSGMYAAKADAVAHITPVKDAWWDMGIALAQNYISRIAPQWQTGNRNIYMINKFPDMSMQAYRAMQNDAYVRAFDIWEIMLMSCRKYGQKGTKSQITYNMAVACEFQNQLEQAIEWVQKSADIKQKYMTASYLNFLNKREKDKIKLNKQIEN